MEVKSIQELYKNMLEAFLALPAVKDDVLNERVLIPDEKIPEVTMVPEGERISNVNRPEYRVRANFRGSLGDAYTEKPLGFDGTLREALDIPPTEKGVDARTVAAMNAVMSHFGYFNGIFPDDPEIHQKYADRLCVYVSRNFGRSNIILIGYDGYIVKTFVDNGIDFWTMDRNPENITKNRFRHVVTNSGYWNRESAFSWGKIFIITGSTLCNGTITQYLGRGIEQGRQLIFYGITAAAPMKLLCLPWFSTDGMSPA